MFVIIISLNFLMIYSRKLIELTISKIIEKLNSLEYLCLYLDVNEYTSIKSILLLNRYDSYEMTEDVLLQNGQLHYLSHPRIWTFETLEFRHF